MKNLIMVQRINTWHMIMMMMMIMMTVKISVEAACDGAIIRVVTIVIVVTQIKVIVEEIWMVIAEWKDMTLIEEFISGSDAIDDGMLILMMIKCCMSCLMIFV